MQTLNIDLDQSDVVVAWNKRGLAGYAVHTGQTWSCVACQKSGPELRIYRQSGKAMHWLKNRVHADSLEVLQDRKELNPLVRTLSRAKGFGRSYQQSLPFRQPIES